MPSDTDSSLTAGKADFAARLARVRQGGIGSNRTIFVGLDEVYLPRTAAPLPPVPAEELVESPAAFAQTLPIAALLGIAAVVLGRCARFHLLPEVVLEAQFDMMANILVALALGLLFSYLMRLTRGLHLTALVLGVLAGVSGFHNLMHWFPSAAATLFSSEWVLTMLIASEPNSLLVRGMYFSFAP
jgi:hypothetical protein